MNLKGDYLKVLKSNQRSSGGFRYTVPSGRVYPHQWFWDSCFHAIIYTHFDIGYAKDEIRSLLSSQWGNGMVPHLIYWTRPERHKRYWGTKGDTSSITHPPLIAYAVERIFRKDGDAAFVEEVLEGLHRYYQWLRRERSSSGLVSIVHPWESGEDDFIAWDEVYGLKNPSREELMRVKLSLLSEYARTGLDARAFLKTGGFSVKSLGFNSVYLRSLKSMLFLCRAAKSGHRKHYERLIPRVKKVFRKQMYNRESGLFHSLYGKDSRPSAVKDSSVFLPLFAGVPTKGQARFMVKDCLLNEEMFWLKYPVPTVSADNVKFDPDRYWRGSTWININWFILKGLGDYGYGEVCRELKGRSIRLVRKSGFCEYFDSTTGRGFGPRDFTWSGLVFDM
jgi:glycogen debranching enzyme